jgi:hypothetical protein
MSTSTTIIISIATTTSTAITSTEGREDKVNGSTILSTAEMRRMATEELQINSALTIVSSPEAVTARAQAIGQAAARARVIVRGAELVLAIVPVAVQARVIVRGAELVLAIVPVAVQARVIVLGAELVLAIVPVVAPVQATDQVVAPELAIAQVAELELAIVQAAAPAIGLAVAELELGQVAVAPRTKSVIAAHRRGLAHLEVEGLAAVVETMREPAAIEAAVAWAAAV